jgi:two-component system NtrC family sensor kinase
MADETPFNVLIVDDRLDDIELMTEALKQAYPGCRITTSRSAEEAQKKVAENPWNLILLDYKLPGQTGLNLLPSLMQAAPAAALIMLTGHGSEQVAVEAMRLGADYYLKKSSALLTELPLVANQVMEKRRLRQELELARSRLQSLIDHVNDIIYELDAEGRFIYISREVEWSLGYNPAELTGKHFTVLMPAETAGRLKRLFSERRTGARATRGLEVPLIFKRRIDIDLQTRGGELRTFEVNASGLYDSRRTFLGTAGVARDITRRKQEEAARREFESRLETVMELASDAIYMKSLDGRYLLANEATRRVLSRTDGQILGKTDADLLDPETAKEFQRADQEVFATGQRVESLKKEYLPSGEVRLWHSVKTPHRTPDGRIVGLFGISRDVTEQAKREEESHHAEKLKAMGQLVAGVAHELNNPLTTILGYAHLLREQSCADHQCRERAEIILTQAERTAKIVQDLLTFARPHALSREPVRLNEIIERELRHQAESLTAHAVTTRVELDASLPLVALDGHQIRQVLGNLIENACDAMWEARRGGALTVTTSYLPSSDGRQTAMVQLEVADTGPGVPEPLRRQIFTPFFTTKPAGKGTGLGLAIIDSIITKHEGTIRVDEAPGGGARFVIRLPAREASATDAPTAGDAPCASTRRGNIVVLEDEPMIRALMEEVLGQEEHQVASFADGEAALAYLREKSASVDVIVSDIKMPGMSGEEFYVRLRDLAPALTDRIVFCTGDTMEEKTARLVRQTGNLSIPKPFTPQKLLDTVGAVLARTDKR